MIHGPTLAQAGVDAPPGIAEMVSAQDMLDAVPAQAVPEPEAPRTKKSVRIISPKLEKVEEAPAPPPQEPPKNTAETLFGGEAPVSSTAAELGGDDPAIFFTLHQLEGSKLRKEPKGYSRFGMGYGASEMPEEEVRALTYERARDIMREKYLAGTNYDQLKSEQDRVAYGQALLHRPAWVREFERNWKGPIGGKVWRNALLDYQQKGYDRNKKSTNYVGWSNRVKRARNYGAESEKADTE